MTHVISLFVKSFVEICAACDHVASTVFASFVPTTLAKGPCPWLRWVGHGRVEGEKDVREENDGREPKPELIEGIVRSSMFEGQLKGKDDGVQNHQEHHKEVLRGSCNPGWNLRDWDFFGGSVASC